MSVERYKRDIRELQARVADLEKRLAECDGASVAEVDDLKKQLAAYKQRSRNMGIKE